MDAFNGPKHQTQKIGRERLFIWSNSRVERWTLRIGRWYTFLSHTASVTQRRWRTVANHNLHIFHSLSWHCGGYVITWSLRCSSHSWICKDLEALELTTRRRVVCTAALRRVCLQRKHYFLPSFPIPEMSDLELGQAVMEPRRWIELWRTYSKKQWPWCESDSNN
jgi:hypothetical protein